MARRPSAPRRPAPRRRAAAPPPGAHARPEAPRPERAAKPSGRAGSSAAPEASTTSGPGRRAAGRTEAPHGRAATGARGPAPTARARGAGESAAPGAGRRDGALVPAADRFRDLVRPRPWRRRRRMAVIGVLVTLVVIGLAVAAVAFLPAFRIDTVAVRGTGYVDPAAVRSAVSDARGTSILRVSTGDLERSARAVPGVRTASVRRSWPHSLTVTVTERVPLATVSEHGTTVVVDGSGVPLPDRAGTGRHLVPLAVGDGSTDPSGATRAMLDVVGSLPSSLRGRVTAVTSTTASDVTLAVTTEHHGSKTLVWGTAQDGSLKARVTAALLEADGTVIDVSSPVAPVTR